MHGIESTMRDHAPLLLVRYRRGEVGESRRQVHTVECADVFALPAVLVARCGEKLETVRVDQLREPRGMLCVACMAQSDAPGMDRVRSVFARTISADDDWFARALEGRAG